MKIAGRIMKLVRVCLLNLWVIVTSPRIKFGYVVHLSSMVFFVCGLYVFVVRRLFKECLKLYGE